MHELYELKEKLMRELEDYSKNGKFSKEDVEAIKYITSAIDHICNITEREEDEYSENMGGSYGRGSSYRGSSYRGNGRSSYARGRGERRDSMGRYSNEGYSMANDGMIADLREMMETVPEGAKSKIRSLISDLERM